MKVCGRMSRGQSQTKTRSVRTVLRRCNDKSNNNTIVVDVDIGKVDVIIVDAPESSNRKAKCLRNPNKMCFPTVIRIDEEDDDNIGFSKADYYATSSKIFHSSSSNSYTFEEFDSDECQLLTGKGKSRTKWMFDIHSSDCSTSTSDTSESGISESDIFETEDSECDSSDCEIMDGSSRNIQEEWEKAALMKKIKKRHARSKDGVGDFGSLNDSGVSPSKASEEVHMNSCDTVEKKDGAQSNSSTSVTGTDELLNGFTEEHFFKLERKDSVRVPDHTVSESSRERCHSKIINEQPSETSLHRCHSQPEVSFDHKAMAGSWNQDIPLQSPFSCDRWVQHVLQCQSGGVSSMDREDNEGASLSTADLQDEPQNEGMRRHGNLSSCDISCSSQRVPNQQTGKVNDVAQDSSTFRPHSGRASSEPNEQQTDMLCTNHSFGEVISQGSPGNFMQGGGNPGMILQSNTKNVDPVSNIQNDIVGEWERFKESEEYKRAEEAEWASRQRQLQIQSEEARRLRKRKKAENLRLLDMEKRQKQRVEEIRESQKRDEETINLKEQLRVEIQKELKKLEMKHRDMASLLRDLGINVGGGLCPLSHEVNAAYKQALLRFHPDRAARADIRQQVEAEEKFKLISRLKEKLLPVAY